MKVTQHSGKFWRLMQYQVHSELSFYRGVYRILNRCGAARRARKTFPGTTPIFLGTAPTFQIRCGAKKNRCGAMGGAGFARGGARPFWDARGGPHFAPLMNTIPPLQYVCLCERKTVNENQIWKWRGRGKEVKLMPGYTPLNGKNDPWWTPPPKKKFFENFFWKLLRITWNVKKTWN